MQTQFTRAMDDLKSNVSKMADLVNLQLNMAFRSLEEHDVGLVLSVIERDREIDAYENLIQERCENLLALFQPVAVDLRYIITVLLINYQLERCGDIAVNIVHRVQKIVAWKRLEQETLVVEMARQAQGMIVESIASFLTGDLDRAKSVLRKDDEVDEKNRTVFYRMVEKMKADPDFAELGAHLIVLSRHLERLADHATNVAEDVVFLIEDQIIAHKNL